MENGSKYLLAACILVLLSASPVNAARIVNEASGIACYSTQDLLTAHSAFDFSTKVSCSF